MFIFGCDVAGSVKNDFSTIMRLYSFKIYRDCGGRMALVRDFVPCVENATGKAGLYDLACGRFHANARAGVEDFKYRLPNAPTIMAVH